MHALPKAGIRRDIDKDPAKMTKEEREVFNCLEEEEFDENHVYEELEDDFLMLANEGQPALAEAPLREDSDDENNNKGVVIFKDEEAEALKNLRMEALKKIAAAKNKVAAQEEDDDDFEDVDDNEEDEDEEEVEEEEVNED